MAFGGNMGAAGNMVPAAALRSPRGTVTYDVDGLSVIVQGNQLDPFNRPLPYPLARDGGVGKRVNSLVIFPQAVGANPALGDWVNVSIDGSADDTGVLVTAAPAANQHGIPINFGPGRGNWTEEHIWALTAQLMYQDPAPSFANMGLVFLYEIQFVGAGNILMTFKNMGDNDITTMPIRLHLDHSIVP